VMSGSPHVRRRIALASAVACTPENPISMCDAMFSVEEGFHTLQTLMAFTKSGIPNSWKK
jgi:hypothetical protein